MRPFQWTFDEIPFCVLSPLPGSRACQIQNSIQWIGKWLSKKDYLRFFDADWGSCRRWIKGEFRMTSWTTASLKSGFFKRGMLIWLTILRDWQRQQQRPRGLLRGHCDGLVISHRETHSSRGFSGLCCLVGAYEQPLHLRNKKILHTLTQRRGPFYSL